MKNNKNRSEKWLKPKLETFFQRVSRVPIGKKLTLAEAIFQNNSSGRGGREGNQLFHPRKTLIMGILNITPDSFSDGGKYLTPEAGEKRALEILAEGADILDIGGESSGPDSKEVSLENELKRIIPVIQKIRTKSDCLISVDTYKSKVAKKAIEAGANMVNDVTAFRGDPKLASVLAKYKVPVTIMYSKDPNARTTRKEIHYTNVVQTIKDFLSERIEYAMSQGLSKEQLIIDPGMGAFISMDPKYSLEVLKKLDQFKTFGLPILIGPSRKSFIGQILHTPLDQRLEGGLACSAIACWNGASIVRVHDVQSTRRVVDMVDAIKKSDI